MRCGLCFIHILTQVAELMNLWSENIFITLLGCQDAGVTAGARSSDEPSLFLMVLDESVSGCLSDAGSGPRVNLRFIRILTQVTVCSKSVSKTIVKKALAFGVQVVSSSYAPLAHSIRAARSDP